MTDQPSATSNDGNSTPTSEAAAQALSAGLLDLYVPHLKQTQAALDELSHKQAHVLAGIESQNRHFTEHSAKPTVDLMHSVAAHRTRLIAIRKRMLAVHQRVQALKKRALYIRDFKCKEQEDRLRRRQQEESLIAGASTTHQSSSDLYSP